MTVTITLLDHRDRAGLNLWRLEHDYYFEIGPGCVITVPKGYVTNFGTIPRIFFRIITPAELREASLVHDWMCNEDFEDDGKDINSGYSRWFADATLYEAMGRVGIPYWKRKLVFYAVRTYAWWRGLE